LLDENNAYSFNSGVPISEKHKEVKELSPARQKRLEEHKKSELPYSFNYKIRNAFHGEKCPLCGCTMNNENNLVKPTIQHNIPISKGGEHEITNISVICQSCNTSVQNREQTGKLNNDQVIRKWNEIGNGSGMDTQVRLGEDSIGEGTTYDDGKDASSLPTSLSTKKDVARWKEHVKQRGATDYPPAFESFWQAYPRSADKKGAARAYLQTLESGVTVEQLQRAAEGYARECEGKEEKYVKHAKTFLGPEEPWRDYADYEPPKDDIKIAKKKIMVDRPGEA
jgi:5-methylcytosine-specific restriction endonuclease McrA